VYQQAESLSLVGTTVIHKGSHFSSARFVIKLYIPVCLFAVYLTFKKSSKLIQKKLYSEVLKCFMLHSNISKCLKNMAVKKGGGGGT
jgi:hypothetical protein